MAQLPCIPAAFRGNYEKEIYDTLVSQLGKIVVISADKFLLDPPRAGGIEHRRKQGKQNCHLICYAL